MTLGRLLAAWLPVAIWFAGVAGVLARRLTPEHPYRAAARGAIEALVLTLLGSLWFDSLGTGAWWLPVTLVGALVALARTSPSGRPGFLLFAIDIIRYLGAGALLAWRLGR